MELYSETTTKSFDDTQIWYRRIGTQDPTLVLCDGVGCAGFIWKYLIPHFEKNNRIVHFNYRGHGKSAPPQNLDNLGIEECAEDLLYVLNDSKINSPVVLIGHSMGVQVVLEFYHRYPERVQALIPLTGSYGRALDHIHDMGLFKQVVALLKLANSKLGGIFTELWRRLVYSEFSFFYATKFEINEKLVKREDFFPYLEHLGKMDPTIFLRLLDGASRHTAEPYLSEIKVPTLIVASEQDRFTPYWLSRRMHAMIPGATLLTLPLGSHTGPIEHPELTNLRIEKFLSELGER